MAQPLRFDATVQHADTRYVEFAPPADLADVVVCTWTGTPGPSRRLRVLPDGCCDLSWNGEDLVVAPPRAGVTRHQVPAAGTVTGIRLAPHAAAAVLGVSPVALADAAVVSAAWADDTWCAAARDLAANRDDPLALRRLLEDVVRCRRGLRGEAPSSIRGAIGLLADGAAVDDAARHVGLGARQFRDRFTANVGLGPKAFQQTIRFHGFVAAVRSAPPGGPWLAGLAAAHGYADQAHLSRECRRFAGTTPRRLVARIAGITA